MNYSVGKASRPWPHLPQFAHTGVWPLTDRASGFPTDLIDGTLAAPRSAEGGEVEFLKLLLALRLMLNYFVREIR